MEITMKMICGWQLQNHKDQIIQTSLMAIQQNGYSMDNQKVIDLFSGVINEESLDNLTKDELDSIKRMLTEAGY